MLKKPFYILAFVACFALTGRSSPAVEATAAQAGAPISPQTRECLDCHETLMPGLSADWRRSRHALVSPNAAMEKPEQEQRMSGGPIPESFKGYAVGCYECHGLRGEAHKDNFDHNGYKINVIVSSDDCAVCHGLEAQQYAVSKKAHALDNLRDNPLFSALTDSVSGPAEMKRGRLHHGAATDTAKAETCYACHGTEVGVSGMRIIPNEEMGDVEVPVLTNWPNQGVGRINPDGSRGACTACHPRHSFSVETARKPFTCSQCHLQPDTPAWDVYLESKHGNLFSSHPGEGRWDRVPLTVGADFTAPTCAVCHNALIVNKAGDAIAERTHDFGARLWVRIFGLPVSHAQPASGKTAGIKNKDGQPLPAAFTGEPSSVYLIDKKEQARRQAKMTKVCASCHGTSWALGHLDRFEKTVREADGMVLTATKIMKDAWDLGLCDPSNPFDEALEKKWISQWLFNANSLRYGSAMGGPDYATFKYGWWDLNRNVEEMKKEIQFLKAAKDVK